MFIRVVKLLFSGLLKLACGGAGVILWILVVGEARVRRKGRKKWGIKHGGRHDESLGTRFLTASKICFI